MSVAELPGGGGRHRATALVELGVGVMTGVTRLKMFGRVHLRRRELDELLGEQPGGQPGTSVSSATLVKSRSLNTK